MPGPHCCRSRTFPDRRMESWILCLSVKLQVFLRLWRADKAFQREWRDIVSWRLANRERREDLTGDGADPEAVAAESCSDDQSLVRRHAIKHRDHIRRAVDKPAPAIVDA